MCGLEIFKQCFGSGQKKSPTPGEEPYRPPATPPPPPPTLMCFDFDGILAEGGAVKDVMRTIPTERFFGRDDFSNYFEDPKVVQGENEVKLHKAIDSLTLVSGMRELIEVMSKKGARLIVISDNLDIVIERFLENQGLRPYFQKVYSHQAKFNSRDVLEIKPSVAVNRKCKTHFEMNKNWAVENERSDRGRTVALMGAGKNNVSLYKRWAKDTGTGLTDGDLACVRNGSGLFEHFRTNAEDRQDVDATFFRWTSGLEILQEMENRGF